MEHAEAEISHAGEFDYIVENRDLDVALADIRAILRASRLATFPAGLIRTLLRA